MDTEFSGDLFEWRGPAPFYWVALSEEARDDVREVASLASYGWGAIPVQARIGSTVWETSLLPKDGGYVLPVKKAVRVHEDIGEGDDVAVIMTIASRHGRHVDGTSTTF